MLFWAGPSDCPKLYPCIEISFHIFVQSTERSQFERSRSFSLWEVKVIDIMPLTNCQSICDFHFAFHFRADLHMRKIYGLLNLCSVKSKICFACSYKLMCGLLFSNVSHTHQCRDTIEILTFIGIFARSEFLYSNDLTGS